MRRSCALSMACREEGVRFEAGDGPRADLVPERGARGTDEGACYSRRDRVARVSGVSRCAVCVWLSWFVLPSNIRMAGYISFICTLWQATRSTEQSGQ